MAKNASAPVKGAKGTKRIPFAVAISHPSLLKVAFDELSGPQQVALKALYGLPLNDKELRYWAMFNGAVEYDYLGYPIAYGEFPYKPQEYSLFTACLGRRSGKSDRLSAFVIAYEATCGGHEEYVKKGQSPVCAMVAQDQRLARENMPFITSTIETSPTLSKMLVKASVDELNFNNGAKIMVLPASLKAIRGYAIAAIAMDEVGFWYTDAESANPDLEVERAAAKAQGQFPFRKRLTTSTPWLKDGILWRDYKAGTGGWKLPEGPRRRPFRDTLVLHATTPGMQNPLLDKQWFESEWSRDEAAYAREILAQFPEAISGFLNPLLLGECVAKGIAERPATVAAVGEMKPTYVAAFDPAFRNDAFTFTIVHKGATGVVQDLVRRWKAPSSKDALNPADILDEIVPILKTYGIRHVYSDQYQLESLKQLALNRGFSIEGVDFTNKSKAKIFGSFQQLVNSKEVALLDGDVSPTAHEQMAELLRLEKKQMAGGNVQISAPPGKHDDLACVLALATHQCLYLPGTMSRPTTEASEPTLAERCWAQIKKQRMAAHKGSWWGK